MRNNRLRSESGFAAIIALLMVGMLTLIGIAALSTSDDEVQITANGIQEMRSFYAAEAGLESAAAALQFEYENTGVPPVVMPVGQETVNNCDTRYVTADDGPPIQRKLTQGSMAGLNALVKSFSIYSQSTSKIENSKTLMSQSFETALVPIFQFAVFYNNDLEIAPGPAMTLAGRVHTNGDMYLQAGNSLNIDSYVTAAGVIKHGRKGPGGVSSGDVKIKDASGTYVSMKEPSGWLEGTDSYWYDSSLVRWQGRVQDKSHGQQPLKLPLTTASGDPHKIIEPALGNSDSFENKATLKIIDNVAFQNVGGVWYDVTADMTAKGIITYVPDKFTDQRESAQVDVLELNINQMYNYGYEPSNGVLYVSSSVGDYPALRLNNASELGDGLTIASSNPIYTNGDFNSINKKPAAIMGDAVTFLSNSWDDSKSNQSKNNRIAAVSSVNASIMTGNIETTSSNYSGGFENLPRFLEKWSGKNFNWKGSMVNLWTSQQATGLWSGSYYSPPNRNWSYDPDLDDPNKLPPETPVIRVFQRTGWEQAYVGNAQGWRIDSTMTLIQ